MNMRHPLLLCLLISCLLISAKPIIIPGYTAYADRNNRLSSKPFLSGDTFRSFADHIIDDTKIPFEPEKVIAGDVIFVFTGYLPYFFKKIHPLIQSPYILISHNSDSCAPGLIDFNGFLKEEAYPVDLRNMITKTPTSRNLSSYLDDEKIIVWFAENANIIHPKLIPIPIGLANRYWPHGKIEILKQAIEQGFQEKKHFLYLNITTNTPERRYITDFFAESLFAYNSEKKPLLEYLIELSQSLFVLSPPGGGIDCHRTWEALYMGAIPIVRTSCLDSLFSDLPVIIISRWEDINEEFLKKKFDEIRRKNLNIDKLFADYWQKLIITTRNNYLKNKELHEE